MNLAFAINKQYIPYFFVVLKSIEKNSLPGEDFTIHIMFIDLTELELNQLKIEFPHFKFIWHNMNNFEFGNFFVNGHISYETYFRIILPEIIDVDKVLYLDSDLIVRRPLNDLYNKNIESVAIAAAYDYKAQERKKELGIPDAASYFNAGVLLMNLEYWRNYNLTNILEHYIQEMGSNLKYWDQDALNALLYDKVLIVEDTWNIQTANFELEYYDKNNLTNPAIVHFTGASKPWHISSENLFKNEYHEYLQLGRFRDNGMVSENTKKLINTKEEIYIWGAGSTGEKVYEHLEIQIQGFIDSDKRKVGHLLKNKLIYSIEQIQRKDRIGILVCSGYYKEIANILKEYRYQENIDFVHQM